MHHGCRAFVNVSSIFALRPRGLMAYMVSTGAVIALTKAIAVDRHRRGWHPRELCCPWTGLYCAPARGTGWDIGGAVRFLASDQARYITGQVQVVDGGAVLVGPSRSSQ
jgi:NAD(P)-dependent dehydrogenase (short-subunit alcohol dehydrogenase family)